MTKSKDELLNALLVRLENISKAMSNQEINIAIHMSKLWLNSEKIELLIAHIKSLKTSVELLREEIDELHQIMLIEKK
jgi:hypothetical protein